MSAPRSPALFFGRDAELSHYLAEMPRVRLCAVYGVGGIGKTAFSLRASEMLADAHDASRAYVRCRQGESAATLAVSVLDQLAPTDETWRSRPIEALIERSPLVLVLDDAHLAEPKALAELVTYLVGRSDQLFVTLAAREAVPISPIAIDHLRILLGALDAGDVQRLWSALESLYGARPRAASVGTPLLIKRAFADVETADDPLGLGLLDPLERELFMELVALRRPTNRARLANGREPGAVDHALARLEKRFLIELGRDPSGNRSADRLSVHDVIRDAMSASQLQPGREAHARAVEHYRADAGQHEPALIELFHHAVSSQADDLLLELLAVESAQLRRIPPGSTLLDREIRRAIDSLSTRHPLSLELQLLRARVRARHGEAKQAWEDLERVEATTPAVDSDRAEIASMMGWVERAIAASDRVLANPAGTPLEHVMALAVAADAERTRGNIPRALELIERETEPLSLLGPLLDGVRGWVRGLTLTDAERYVEAAEEFQKAHDTLLSTFPIEAMPLLRPLERMLAVLCGSAVLPSDEAGEIFDDNAYFRCVARLLRAQELVCRGDLDAARALCEETEKAGDALGSLPIVGWARWVWAEAAAGLGEYERILAEVPAVLARVDQANHVPPRVRLELALAEAHLALADRPLAIEHALRAQSIGREYVRSRTRAALLLERAGKSPPAPNDGGPRPSGYGASDALLGQALLALERRQLVEAERFACESEANAARYGWEIVARRARLVRAECELVWGNPRAVRELLAAPKPDVDAHARLHAAVLEAALARAESGAAMSDLESRFDRTWEKLALPRLVERLHLHEPLAFEVLSDRGAFRIARAQLDALRLDADLVVDRARGTIRVGDRTLDGSRRGTLLDLLVALAREPDRALPPAELAQRGWGLDYHAIRHHSRLAMAIARLRELVGGEVIEGGRDGYRIASGTRFVIVSPLAT